MANILINGFSAKSGGGKAIFDDFLSYLCADTDTEHRYFIIVNNVDEYSCRECSHVRIVTVPFLSAGKGLLPFFYLVFVPHLVKRRAIDVVFNFADLILPVKVPQIYLFDWAYFVYPDSIVWKRMPLRDLCVRKVKAALMECCLRFISVTIAQTETMAKRLNEVRGLRDVVVVPNAVTMDTPKGRQAHDFNLPEGKKKLLFLSSFSPHRNFEIVVPLARLLKRENSEYVIVTTLDAEQGRGVRRLFSQLNNEGLGDYVLNVGKVQPKDVSDLFEQCDALFLPTLLESYGLPFIEAMHNGRPIFTSDYDFARDVCREAAYYFNAMDEESIYEQFVSAFSNEERLMERVEIGREYLRTRPSREAVYEEYKSCIEKVLLEKNDSKWDNHE